MHNVKCRTAIHGVTIKFKSIGNCESIGNCDRFNTYFGPIYFLKGRNHHKCGFAKFPVWPMVNVLTSVALSGAWL